MVNVFTANNIGTCNICNKQIAIGQRISKNKGGYAHADCLWPSHASAASAGRTAISGVRKPPEAPSQLHPSIPGEGEDVEKVITERVLLAKRIVAKAFKMDEAGISVDNGLVVEVCHQILSEQWLKRDMR